MKKSIQVLGLVMLGLVLTFCKSNPFIEQAKNDIKSQNFDGALVAADSLIKNMPEDGTGYYYKGLAYEKLAESKVDPAERTELYAKMKENFDTASEKYATMEKAPKEAEEIDNILLSAWSTEHNQAVQYIQNDSLAALPNAMQNSVNHMVNATVIEPDSIMSKEVLTEIYLQAGEFEKAGENMREVINLYPQGEAPASNYLRAGQVDLKFENFEDAVEILLEGSKVYPGDINIVTSLANAYLGMGERQKGLEVVKSLIERDPENPQYRVVYGTQLYQNVDILSNQLKEQYDKLFEIAQEEKTVARKYNGKNKKEVEAELEQVDAKRAAVVAVIDKIQAEQDKLSNEASEQLSKAAEFKPNDHQIQYTIGTIKNNNAAALFEQRNAISDNNEKAEELDNKGKEQLNMALKYYEKAAQLVEAEIAEAEAAGEADTVAQLQATAQKYWNQLFRVYTNLGMNDKAMEAMEKAGL